MPSLTRAEIEAILPHREPFIFLDRITECEWGARAVGELDDVARYHDTILRGHFPAFPVLPGAITVEACAEVGAILALGMPENAGKIAVLTGLDGWKFRAPARPGSGLRMEVAAIRYRPRFGRAAARATILATGELAAEGEISFAVIDAPAGLGG
jgi:3-hydroxyacyl-[acyl-carrier-protein] dehydratase